MENKKHRWSYIEDKYCCDLFRDTFITKDWHFATLDWLIEKINNKFPQISKTSVIMKIQNIKQICINLRIKEHSTFKPLAHFSRQNLLAMVNSLNDAGINITNCLK